MDQCRCQRRLLPMYKTPSELIQQALEEDGAFADITTLSTVPEQQWSQGHILTRQTGVIAGLAIAVDTFRYVDERITVELHVQDGDAVQADMKLVSLRGPARSLL